MYLFITIVTSNLIVTSKVQLLVIYCLLSISLATSLYDILHWGHPRSTIELVIIPQDYFFVSSQIQKTKKTIST